MAFFYRCRKCWDDVEMKRKPKSPIVCESCGQERYFHAFGKVSEKPKDRKSEANSAAAEDLPRRFSDG